MGKFDGKKQYLINYEDGLVYYKGVATKSMLNLIEKLDSEGLPTPSKAKVTASFCDSKKIFGKTKHFFTFLHYS